jgi:hypothetical protein
LTQPKSAEMVRLLSRQQAGQAAAPKASPKATVQPRRRKAQTGGRSLQLLLQMNCGFTHVLRGGEVMSETAGVH